MIRPVIRISQRTRDQFADATERQARAAARRELNEIGRAWVDEVSTIVADEYEFRLGDRHKENTTHLTNSFTYRVDEASGGGFPMRLRLTTKPGVSAKKVAALNYGAKKNYTIRPRSPKKKLAWGEVSGEYTTVVSLPTVVQRTPANSAKAGRFMQRARDRVLARRRRQQ